ncbi:MAG: hypothetical protein JXR31_01900 [Prolixibacteraceae bacterium]|nr:hypothetical protein [Prolixibacteraceae bacterium]MBN2772973.1 hypothetical protein [Prolixibacteraceae bacterium]
MKKTAKLLSLLMLTNLILFNCVQAQSDFSLDYNRSIQIKAASEASKIKEIKVECYGRNKYLHLVISSWVKTGTLKIEIIDPAGKTQESFKIESSVAGEEMDNTTPVESMIFDEASGKISKTFENPMKGIWIIKAIPKLVYGKIEVNSQQTDIPKLH